MNPILSYFHGTEPNFDGLSGILLTEAARSIIKHYTLSRLDEVLALHGNNKDVVEFTAVQNFIDLCKRTHLIESITHAGQLENLFLSVFDNKESAFFVRGALIELRLGLGDSGIQLLIGEIASSVFTSAVPDSNLNAKYKHFPQLNFDNLLNLFATESWLVVCLLLKYTSLIDKEVDVEK